MDLSLHPLTWQLISEGSRLAPAALLAWPVLGSRAGSSQCSPSGQGAAESCCYPTALCGPSHTQQSCGTQGTALPASVLLKGISGAGMSHAGLCWPVLLLAPRSSPQRCPQCPCAMVPISQRRMDHIHLCCCLGISIQQDAAGTQWLRFTLLPGEVKVCRHTASPEQHCALGDQQEAL